MDNKEQAMNVVIVTGLSGAGRTQALRALEDVGYFCVDNLPPALVMQMVDMLRSSDSIRRVAIAIDSRTREFFSEVYAVIARLRALKMNLQILFMDASDEVLLRRFNQTRRAHPMAEDGRAISGISLERQLVEPLKEWATVVDTSTYSVKQLRAVIAAKYAPDRQQAGMVLSVSSFGFKYGIPLDANLVLDVRFLPNPYYIDELRNLSGQDAPVSAYVFSFAHTRSFLDKLTDIVADMLPNFEAEDKRQLSIAIGCTGGRHRSVAIAEELCARLKKLGRTVYLEHRDIERDPHTA